MHIIEIEAQDERTLINKINQSLASHQTQFRSNVRDFPILQHLISTLGREDEFLRTELRVPSRPSPPGTMEMLVPETYLHINVKRTSLVAILAVIDAFYTYGLISVAMKITGRDPEGIARLDPSTGEYCNFVHAAKARDDGCEISPNTVTVYTAQKPCRFPQIGCIYNVSGTCSIKVENVEGNFESLLSKSALEKVESAWRVPF